MLKILETERLLLRRLLPEDLDRLGLSRLVCIIDPQNEASIAVARNIGMTLEREMADEKGSFLLYSRSH